MPLPKWQTWAAIIVWLLVVLSLMALLFALAVGLGRLVSVGIDDGWLAALQSVDVRGVGLAAGGVATMVGVAIAALVGYYKFQLFRESRPHLTIDLTASHRKVSPRYIHIGVTARLSNTSKVKIDVKRCVWELFVVAPYHADAIDGKINNFFDSGSALWEEFGWSMIPWPGTQRPDLEIEPGETDEITYDFIVSNGVQSVAVTLAVDNEYYRDNPECGYETDAADDIPVWYRRIFYDLTMR